MKHLVFVVLLCWSSMALANFKYHGELQLQLQSGEQRQQVFTLQLAREDGAYLFTVGKQQVSLPQPPQKYSLSVVLNKDNTVWVTDFVDEPLAGFSLRLGDYQVALSQNPDARSAPGRYVLTFGEEFYYFSRGPAQINFNFDAHGIAEVEVRGMFKPRR